MAFLQGSGRQRYLSETRSSWGAREAIFERVDAITALLLSASGKAISGNDQRWLTRYAWLAKLVDDRMGNAPRQPING